MPVNEAMLDLVDRFNLEQLVMEPTRINNILDLILTTTPVSVHEIKVVPGMSDQEAVTAMCDTNTETNKKKPRVVHIYSKANTDGIEEDLEAISNDFLASCDSRSTPKNWTLFKALRDKAYPNQDNNWQIEPPMDEWYHQTSD